MMVMLLKYIGNKNGGNDMRMMPIASGSSGNCIYVGSDDTHILIDAGISRKKIEEGLNSIDLSLKDIDAVFDTQLQEL